MIIGLVLLGPLAVGSPGPSQSHVGEASVAGPSPEGMDPLLLADLVAGPSGSVVVELTYDRRPTSADTDLLESAYGVEETYVYNNWDEILVRVPYDALASLLAAPGVERVTKVLPARLALETATQATRVAEGEGTFDGLDHALSVHGTFGLRGNGTVIAILDTGVDNTHASLQGTLVSKVDPLTGITLYGAADIKSMFAPMGCVDPGDSTGHGTHVAGIALGRGSSEVAPGVAPEARLVDIAILGAGIPGLVDGIGVGLDWVLDYNAGKTCYGDPGEDRIDVLSMSVALPTTDPTHPYNQKVTDVVRSGVTVVIAAGNTSPSNQWNTTVPPPQSIGVGPEGSIVVANSYDQRTVNRSDDIISCNSARGPRPAVTPTVADLMPHIAAPGTHIVAPMQGSETGGKPGTGTSMATPHVAGIVALMLQADPGLRPVDHADWQKMGAAGAVPIRDLLIQSAQYKTATLDHCPLYDDETGMFDLPWNDAWGYGLVDAYEAVRLALES